MRVGISGHQELEDKDAWRWVELEMEKALPKLPGSSLTGVSSLAAGADQLLARLVLQSGGSLEVILPFEDYEKALEPAERKEFQKLLVKADKVEFLTKQVSQQQAYLAAGKSVVERASIMIFVWDGLPAKGLGGTADIFKYTLKVKKPFVHLNPLTREVVRSSQPSSD